MNLKDAQEFLDAAQRMSDTITLHLLATSDLHENVGRWCAFKLEDGRSDNDTYPSKDDAIRMQKGDPKQYCYVKIPPTGMPLNDAVAYLRISRHPMIDNTSPEHVINRSYFPRFSNLSPAQKQDLIVREKEARKNGTPD